MTRIILVSTYTVPPCNHGRYLVKTSDTETGEGFEPECDLIHHANDELYCHYWSSTVSAIYNMVVLMNHFWLFFAASRIVAVHAASS